MAIIVDKDGNVVTVENEPEEARAMFPNTRDFGVGDVLIDGTSIVNAEGDAEIPTASSSAKGVISVSGDGLGITSTGRLRVNSPQSVRIKEGTQLYQPIDIYHNHEGVFYGMAKAAGDTTQAASDNAVGNYTDEAKRKILAMLGAEPEEYELIADITTDSSLTELEINKDTSQNSFKLKKTIVVGNIKPSTTGNADTFYTSWKVRINGESADGYISGSSMKYPSGTSELFFRVEGKANKNAPIIVETVYSSGKSTTGNVNSMPKDNIVDYITAFRIARSSTASTSIPAGSTFKIYGIRYPE